MMGALVGGHRVNLRLLERGDESLIRRVCYRCSPDTLYRRFLSPVLPPANALVQRLIDVDHRDRDALVAFDDHGIAGIARYAPAPGGNSYAVAIVVADDWQRKGLGRMLMRRGLPPSVVAELGRGRLTATVGHA
jgi:predicted N-acetyltransferase YhbS